MVKNPPAMQETRVQSLGWEDPLEKRTGHPFQYSGLENSMDSIVHGVARVRHDLATKLLPLLDHRRSREFQKNIYFCFIEYTKAFDCVDHNKLWKIAKEMVKPDHLTCLLRNLYAGQE